MHPVHERPKSLGHGGILRPGDRSRFGDVASHQLAVYLVLRSGDDVLFGLRSGTGYRDGEYGLPSGKVDAQELLIDAIVREAQEEVDLDLDPSSLRLVHMVERDTPTGQWLDFFFLCTEWLGEPRNAEPHKCAALEWLAPDHPAVIDYISTVLKVIGTGEPFSTHAGP